MILGARPERIGPSNGHGFSVELPLDIKEPMGAETLTWFDVEGQRLAARLEPSVAQAGSDRMALGFDLANVALFCRESEQRL